MTIESLKKWVSQDIPQSKIETTYDEVVEGVSEYHFCIYTETNKYKISASDTGERTYLGCISQSRRQRPGEDWFRGNDLPDGKLTKDTWNRILRAIVRYELKDISKAGERESHADTAPKIA